MRIIEAARKPLEFIAGRPYPDIQGVRREASEDRATDFEIALEVDEARSAWNSDLIHAKGLQDQSFRDIGSRMIEGTTYWIEVQQDRLHEQHTIRKREAGE